MEDDVSDRKRGLSRREFLGTTAAAAFVAGVTPSAGIVSAQTPRATDASGRGRPGSDARAHQRPHPHDGRRNTIANTVTIRNGRFVAVGDATPRRGPNARVIDLEGRTVVPGLIEPHIHIVSLANRPGYHTILENTTSIREIQEALAARRKNVPEGQWITSMGGWHPNQWAEHRHPTLARNSTQRCPIGRCCCTSASPARASTNSLGKEFFDAADAAPPVHPDIKKINVSRHRRDRRGRLCRRRSVGQRAVLPAPDADVRGQEAQHARRDELLGQRRADRASRSGAVPDAGTAASRARSCRISTSTGCTTRGSSCTAKARPSSACR